MVAKLTLPIVMEKVAQARKLFGVRCTEIKAAPKPARLFFFLVRVYMLHLFNDMMNTERLINFPAFRPIFLAEHGTLGLSAFKIFVAAHNTSTAFIPFTIAVFFINVAICRVLHKCTANVRYWLRAWIVTLSF